jgi:hypothetical protein
VILLFGVPIYKRAAVGSGKASIEETGAGAAVLRTLFFAAGSDPTRARGLSRLGWMREHVLGPATAPSEISYFGVLTSSPEETLDHARKSTDDTSAGRSVFSAVRGRNAVGHTRSAITHFEFDSKAAWSDRGLIDKAQSMFDGVVNWRETSRPTSQNQPAPTFLTEIVKLFGAPSKRSLGRYVYNEQENCWNSNGTSRPGVNVCSRFTARSATSERRSKRASGSGSKRGPSRCSRPVSSFNRARF